MIRVYDSDETLFATNGIKILHPLVAEITKKDNSDYYLELRDIVDNIQYYQKGMIIRTDTPWGVQGFRCDNPTVNNNRVECKAWHLSYDSKNYIIKDANAVDKNCNDALDYFNNVTDKLSPFKTISNISKLVTTRVIRKSLFEVYQLFINEDKYGGHWDRDNFTLGIRDSVGQDRGVVLKQNKNIMDMKIFENWDNVCTKILPYTTDGEVAIELDETYVEIQDNLYDIPYTKVIKFENSLKQEDFSNYDDFLKATKNWLRVQANAYLEANKLPKVNYSVSAKIDNVSDVGDIIYISHPKCNVNIITNVISIVYDVIREKYIKIEFGNFKKEIKNLTQEITANIKKDTETLINENKIILEKELNEATSKIWGTLGNSFVIYEGDKIFVVDKLPKEEAINCMMINSGGIGFSTTGINGTFNSAWTIDGTLNMQNINVINLVADLIKGGTLKLGGNNNDNGAIEIYNSEKKLIGKIDNSGFCFETNDEMTTIEEQIKKIAQLELNNTSIQSTVSELQTNLNNNYTSNQELNQKLEEQNATITKEMTTLVTQTKSEVTTEIITKINSDGVEKVKNTLVTIDQAGVNVAKSDEDVVSLLSNTGLYTSDGKLKEDNSNLLMKVDRSGAYIKTLKVQGTINENDLIQKEKINHEKYGVCQAWYWIGGSE